MTTKRENTIVKGISEEKLEELSTSENTFNVTMPDEGNELISIPNSIYTYILIN